MSGFGFGVGGFADTFSCGGKEPVWDHPCFKDLTLQPALGARRQGGAVAREHAEPGRRALSLVTAQLYSLRSRSAGRVRKAAGMAHSAFIAVDGACRRCRR